MHVCTQHGRQQRGTRLAHVAVAVPMAGVPHSTRLRLGAFNTQHKTALRFWSRPWRAGPHAVVNRLSWDSEGGKHRRRIQGCKWATNGTRQRWCVCISAHRVYAQVVWRLQVAWQQQVQSVFVVTTSRARATRRRHWFDPPADKDATSQWQRHVCCATNLTLLLTSLPNAPDHRSPCLFRAANAMGPAEEGTYSDGGEDLPYGSDMAGGTALARSPAPAALAAEGGGAGDGPPEKKVRRGRGA